MADVSHGVALRACEVGVRLGSRVVLSPLSLSVGHGEVFAILGPNGAGKSTLLRALAALLPFSGEVQVDGQHLAALSAERRAQLVTYVPQESELTAALPVRDVVALGRYAHGAFTRGAEHADAVARALHESDVEALAERPFSSLSSGEKKRVLLARALCTGARVLLLDEPTAALDIAHALELFALLRRNARAGRAVLVVLHQSEHALEFADRALLLHRGAEVALGSVQDVLTPSNVRQTFGVEMVASAAPAFRLQGGPR